MTIRYDNNFHSVFLLQYHLIFVVKYRRQVIDDNIAERLKEIFAYIGDMYRIKIIEFNHNKDHIHILFNSNPSTALVKFINSYKSASSRLIKKEFPEIKKEIWKEYFWSRSYFLMTTGGVTLDILKKYVESQGKND
ncbi:MAG: IS200/IS605 family transposase [Deltaproteobacteria bacterium]|nr:IS200/IS605 family transposase [Deltaproteobacteria bacterium]